MKDKIIYQNDNGFDTSIPIPPEVKEAIEFGFKVGFWGLVAYLAGKAIFP